MKNLGMQQMILAILSKLDGIAVRESVLAAEVEIRIGHPLTTDEFGREMKELLGRRLVKRSFDVWNEAMYEITGDGKAALMGRA